LLAIRMSVLPRHGMPIHAVLRALTRVKEGLPHHLLHIIAGSMTTVPHPLALEAFRMFHLYNANDLEMFSELRRLEEEAVAMMGEILRCDRGCTGMITSGGSEANIAALYLAREHSLKRVYVAPTAHDSVLKAAKILSLEVVKVGITKGYTIDVNDLEKRCRERGPGLIVATMGTTGFGTIDPIKDIDEVARRYGCLIHVDAAFGGFVAPLLYSEPLCFELPTVISATIDPHKLGQVPIPAGGLIVRSREWFEPLVFEAKYMPASKQIGLLGTRTGGSIAATWAMLKHMGYEGYKKQAEELMDRTRSLLTLLRQYGFTPAAEPRVPIICIELKNDEYVIKSLASKGVYLYRCGLVPGVRIVVMPHASVDVLRKVVEALVDVAKGLRV